MLRLAVEEVVEPGADDDDQGKHLGVGEVVLWKDQEQLKAETTQQILLFLRTAP